MRISAFLVNRFILFLCFCISINLTAQNVPPSITDPEELRATQIERQKVFDSIIDDPTNLENLFNYANLSILVGDLEAAIGIFEQMLIYKPDFLVLNYNLEFYILD